MTKSLKTLFLSFLIIVASTAVAQTKDEPKKEEDEFVKKKVETKLTEVIAIPDSTPVSELVKRGVNWIKKESKTYLKTGGTSTSNKIECGISFPVKPKDLNPEVDYTGKITMKVAIECKDSRYKYTVYDIKHTSKSGRTTAGSIDNKVPDCGSMAMNDLVWKKLKGEALRGAGQVVADLKEGMLFDSKNVGTEEW
jgi:hypothetical protein